MVMTLMQISNKSFVTFNKQARFSVFTHTNNETCRLVTWLGKTSRFYLLISILEISEFWLHQFSRSFNPYQHSIARFVKQTLLLSSMLIKLIKKTHNNFFVSLLVCLFIFRCKTNAIFSARKNTMWDLSTEWLRSIQFHSNISCVGNGVHFAIL